MDLQRSYACPNYARFAEIVTEILRKNGDDIPLGKNWIQRFRERHPELATGRSRPMDISRLLAVTPMAVTCFYDHILSLRERYSVPWTKVWNMDEKGFQLGQIGRQLVFYDKSQGPPAAPSTGNSKWVSIIECDPAEGLALSPFVIHQGTDIYERYFDGVDDNPGFQGWSWAFSTKG